MHVLILPSWYPAKDNSAGMFIYEQAKTLAMNTGMKFSIINWGPNEFVLKFRNPLKSIRIINSFKSFLEETIEHLPNMTEYRLPHITWTSYLKKGNYLAIIPKLINYLQFIEQHNDKIDLIHAHVTFPAGFLAYYLAKYFSIPYIITEHSGPFPFREYISNNELRDIVDKPLSNASEIIAVSSFLAENISKFTTKKPLVIPNSVDTDFFITDMQQKFNRIPQIFTLSQLTTGKGIGDLLQAIKLLKDKGNRFVVRIGGTGKQFAYFKRLAEKLSITGYIVWLGRLNRQEALTEYKNCEFYVMPSRMESLSMVILEAMSCAKPIVSTSCGGPQELVEADTGILTEPANPGSLAEGIENMLNTYYNYDRLTIRNICLRKYSPSTIIPRIVAVYQKVIHN